MHTKRHKKGNAAKRKEKRLVKEHVKVWIHGRGMDKVIVV